MLRQSKRILFGFFILIFVSFVPCISMAATPFDRVIIVSIDGGRSDVIFTNTETINIHSLANKGAYTLWAQSILPSSTLPAHTSMLTGVKASVHKILWNDYQPSKGYVQVTTIFELAKASGLKTAMFVAKEKLVHIAKPGTVDKFKWVNGDARTIARSAVDYIVQEKPNLCFIHLTELDTLGHTFGWGSPKQFKGAIICDKAIGILLDGLASAGMLDQTFIIISADHGGHGTGHGTSDPRDLCVPFICSGSYVKSNYEIQSLVSICDVSGTAAYALGLSIPDSWTGKPIKEVFKERIDMRTVTEK